MRSDRAVGTALLIFAAACFGTLGLSARMSGDLGLDALGYSAWRSGLGGIALAAWLAVLAAARQPVLPTGRVPPRARWALIAAGGASTLLNLAVFMAFERTTIAIALITFYTYPAIVALAATRLYGETLDRIRAGALVLAFAGLALLVLAPTLEAGALRIDPLGIGLAFVAACLQAVYVLISGRGFSSVPATAAAAVLVCIAGASYLALATVTGRLSTVLLPFGEPRLWPWVLLASIVGAALPTAAMMAGLRRIGPTRTAIMMMLEPVVGVLLAALFLAERPAPLQLVGGAAVLVAGTLLQLGPAPPVSADGAHGYTRPPARTPGPLSGRLRPDD